VEKRFRDEYVVYMAFPLSSWNIRDSRVLTAMREVDRSLFVPPHLEEYAGEDRPLPIGRGQTISQPYIVAYMTEALRIEEDSKVLEIGTGSGYQAAVLARLAAEVFSMERIGELARAAAARLEKLGYGTVRVRHDDGSLGWPEAAPFDRIIITAALKDLPECLRQQLKPGGRMIYPEGGRGYQQLTLLYKDAEGSCRTVSLLPVIFVPFLTGRVT
jgi:protein-L-isoaspartate(D-aspartate) O-methyltransferase